MVAQRVVPGFKRMQLKRTQINVFRTVILGVGFIVSSIRQIKDVYFELGHVRCGGRSECLLAQGAAQKPSLRLSRSFRLFSDRGKTRSNYKTAVGGFVQCRYRNSVDAGCYNAQQPAANDAGPRRWRSSSRLPQQSDTHRHTSRCTQL